MFRVALGILIMVSLAATARAQPGRTPPAPATYVPPPPPATPMTGTRTERYTWSIVGTDVVAGGLMMVGVIVAVSGALGGDDESAGVGVAMVIGGAGVYAFGPAFVHVRHHNNASAWKSVALRLGLPLLGGALGGLMDKNNNNSDCIDCTSDGDIAGSLGSIGVIAAMVIDWAVLAKVDVPVTSAYPYAGQVSGGGTTFGLAGAF